MELFSNGKVFGIDHVIFWTVLGWIGNAVFFSRFLVQWYATEKKKRIVVPQAFWWLSLTGSLLLLLYAIFYDRHRVIVFAYAFNWIPYIRSLVIHRRHKQAHINCASCGVRVPPESNFCPNCGLKLPVTS